MVNSTEHNNATTVRGGGSNDFPTSDMPNLVYMVVVVCTRDFLQHGSATATQRCNWFISYLVIGNRRVCVFARITIGDFVHIFQ
jgi:hypothetical protein